MTVQTNLRGRLRNTTLPLGNGLLPLFECVVNSIHAIEDCNASNGKIEISILRDKQRDLQFDDSKSTAAKRITGFRITDNGIGFDESNMQSFRMLDSEHKVNRGGRGVGRLLWLKAFNTVAIESTFRSESSFMTRGFFFESSNGISDEKLQVAEKKRLKTCVSLEGFSQKYSDGCPKTGTSIATQLLEHCLWYFVRSGGVPEIQVLDEDGAVKLDDLFERFMLDSGVVEQVKVKGESFDITHLRIRMTSSRQHNLAYCAASRLVKEESIVGKLPGLFGKLSDEHGDFVYTCYVSSSFLDDRVRAERTDFNISEDIGELFADHEISLRDIRQAVLAKASVQLKSFLEGKITKATERLESFIANRAPRYRPILSRIQVATTPIDPNISDKELDMFLHKQLAELESQLLADGHDLMQPMVAETLVDYQKRLGQYLETAKELKQSDLANYVFHRKVILGLLKKAIERNEHGKYVREDLIHNLIMPMQVDSNQVMSKDCNLWLIDERLAFHDYLASDKPLSSMPITGSNATKEPDLVALNVFDNPILVTDEDSLPLASIVVVEIKRPMRNDASQGEEKDPIEQALGYLSRVRKGRVQTASGRTIPNSDQIPGFCYVLCDVTPSIIERCLMHDAVRTSDGLGYFFFHKGFSAYVEVMSFDRLVNGAEERNRAFFDKLGLPSN